MSLAALTGIGKIAYFAGPRNRRTTQFRAAGRRAVSGNCRTPAV